MFLIIVRHKFDEITVIFARFLVVICDKDTKIFNFQFSINFVPLPQIFKHKYMSLPRYGNNRFTYYLKHLTSYYFSEIFSRKKTLPVLFSGDVEEEKYIQDRVNYYNKMSQTTAVTDEMTRIADFKRPKKRKGHSTQSAYFLDLYHYLRYFPKNFRFSSLFGDVTHIPDVPTIVKSRPIAGDNENSIILNINKVRHFLFIKDRTPFEEKKDMLVGRMVVWQPHRIRFWEMYFGNPLCNLGQTDKYETLHREWITALMPIKGQLEYKFILCLEGNDVSTNLKWVMSSNSLAVMPRPRYETWFMEGRLIPNVHYVEIKSDYSDLEERLKYYIEHPDEALQIIENAHRHVSQFLNRKRERYIAALTLKKYFEKTSQYEE